MLGLRGGQLTLSPEGSGPIALNTRNRIETDWPARVVALAVCIFVTLLSATALVLLRSARSFRARTFL